MAEMLQITPRGPFSLQAAAEFGFGPNSDRTLRYDGVMRLAFPVDGGRGYAGAMLPQPEPDGPVEVELTLTEGADPRLPAPLTLEGLTELAEPWRPFRTWVTVLLRLAGDRSRQR